MTRLPLCTPARTMATVPAVREALTFLTWLAKKFLEVPRGSSIHSWDIVGQLLRADHASSSILGSTNLLLNKDSGLLGGSLLVHLLGELVDRLLVVHTALAEPV